MKKKNDEENTKWKKKRKKEKKEWKRKGERTTRVNSKVLLQRFILNSYARKKEGAQQKKGKKKTEKYQIDSKALTPKLHSQLICKKKEGAQNKEKKGKEKIERIKTKREKIPGLIPRCSLQSFILNSYANFEAWKSSPFIFEVNSSPSDIRHAISLSLSPHIDLTNRWVSKKKNERKEKERNVRSNQSSSHSVVSFSVSSPLRAPFSFFLFSFPVPSSSFFLLFLDS